MLRVKITTHLEESEVLAEHLFSVRSATAHFDRDDLLSANNNQRQLCRFSFISVKQLCESSSESARDIQ